MAEKTSQYDINIAFKMKGNIPAIINISRIEDLIRKTIAENCTELYLHGEYYGCYGKEWCLSKITPVKIKVIEEDVEL